MAAGEAPRRHETGRGRPARHGDPPAAGRDADRRRHPRPCPQRRQAPPRPGRLGCPRGARAQLGTALESRWGPTFRLTRWRALSTVLVSQPRRSADLFVGATVQIQQEHLLSRSLRTLVMQETSDWTSSVEITWLTGSGTVRRQRRRRGLALPARGRSAWLNETYELSGVCLLRGDLDSGDDLPRYAQLGEVAKAGLAVER